jgi:hypothetical protein
MRNKFTGKRQAQREAIGCEPARRFDGIRPGNSA